MEIGHIANEDIILNMSQDSRSRSVSFKWYGQSGYRFQSPTGRVFLVDPWLDCPTNPNPKASWDELGQVDTILLTHGHFDHSANVTEIANRTGAELVTVAELADALIQYLGFPTKNEIIRGRTGSKVSAMAGELEVTFIKAVHGSSIKHPTTGETIETGDPVGFAVQLKGGPKLHFSGDTALFEEMNELAGEKFDVSFICMGGHFTMDPSQAAEAMKRIRPRVAVPNHYGTFDVLTGTPAEFAAEMAKLDLDIPMFNPIIGEEVSLSIPG